jgi:hypothetical protein
MVIFMRAVLASLFAGSAAAQGISYDSLMGNSQPSGTASDAFFGPSSNALPASNSFEGSVRLTNPSANAQISIVRDDYNYGRARRFLPNFNFDFVQTSDDRLAPSTRGLHKTGDAFWNVIVGVGSVWDEPGNADQGYSRASIPFTLNQVNSQCVHNGVMLFLYRSDGRTSQLRYQVTQETCVYYKVNLWGQLDVNYSARQVSGASRIRTDWTQELADRVPVKSLADDLERDYPGVDASVFASGISDAHLTTYGIVAAGSVYTARCRTRQGEYYYCSEMVTPSYSTSKSLFAGLVMMRLAERYGTQVYDQRITDWLNPDPAWGSLSNFTNVTFRNTVDMATGNYQNAAYGVDEAGTERPFTTDLFFLSEFYLDKLYYSYRFPPKVAPGTFFSYHSTDTFLVTTAMQTYLQSQSDQPSNADIFDFLVDEIFRPLKIQIGAYSSLKTDNCPNFCRIQAFGGYGLFFTIDDIAKITQFVSNGGHIGNQQVVHAPSLAGALQQSSSDRGLNTNNQGGDGLNTPNYNYGFWSNEYQVGNCRAWVPYASGYGGIRFVFNPNGIVYFYVSDNGEFSQAAEIVEVDKMAPQC